MTAPDSTRDIRRELFLLLWAGTSTAAALMLAALALYLYLHPRTIVSAQLPLHEQRSANAQKPAEQGTSSFASVRESDIPGRYRFFENGVELGTMLLKPDHTFINKDGTTFKQYRWDISADGLVIVWQRSTSRFTVLGKPGVYVAPAGNAGKEHRLEKLD